MGLDAVAKIHSQILTRIDALGQETRKATTARVEDLSCTTSIMACHVLKR
jgi:hypothetical protein